MLINIVIPVVVLSFLSKEQYLGTKPALIVAFAFPVLYGIKDLLVAKKINFFSILGVVTVGLTGGMGLLEIDPKYIAIKEAAVPAALGIFTLFSLKTRYPLVKTFIYNKQFVKVDRIDAALAENNSAAAFEKSLQTSSILLALSFFVSATTNYVLAKVVLVSAPGTEAFNVELGKMLALSYPVNVIPAMIVQIIAGVYTYKSVKKHTHLTFDEILGIEEE
ncbi:MAG: MFS transporter [Cellvibrionaceae bacterium]